MSNSLQEKIKEHKILHEKLRNFRLIHYNGFMILGTLLILFFPNNFNYVNIGAVMMVTSVIVFIIVWGKLYIKYIKLRNEINNHLGE